jgi:hypothetical protein
VKPAYANGEWVTAWIPEIGTVSGNMRKRKGRWWFFGDVLRDIRFRPKAIRAKGGTINTHRAP